MNGERPDDADVTRSAAPEGLTVVLVVLAVAVLGAVTIWVRLATQPADVPPAVDLTVAVLSCVLAPVLLWRPVPAALGLIALAAVSQGATPAATLAALLVAQRHGFPAAGWVGAAGIAAHAVQGAWRPNEGISFGWWLILITLCYTALVGWGALSRARRALLASLRERARRAEAEQGRRVAEARMHERTRLAREMHDVLAHRLSLVATYAGALEYRPDAPPEQLTHAAGVVRSGVHQALDELRDVIGLLRDDTATGDGRPQPTLADVPTLVEESEAAGAPVRLHDDVSGIDELPAALGRTVYRVVQEGLTNARKHAGGLPVDVVLEGGPGARLTVDIRNPLPEAGFTPPVPGTGTGLVGLTERVRLAGGQLDHGKTRTGEFRLHASLPWPA